MEIISQIFGIFLLFYIIALAFDWMSNNKSLSMSKGVVSITLKILGALGQLLAKFAVPLLRDIGDKIVYVTNYYLDKNKQQQPQSLLPPTNEPQAPDENQPPQGTTQPPHDKPSQTQSAPDKGTTKNPSNNPYDDPPEPEIMD